MTSKIINFFRGVCQTVFLEPQTINSVEYISRFSQRGQSLPYQLVYHFFWPWSAFWRFPSICARGKPHAFPALKTALSPAESLKFEAEQWGFLLAKGQVGLSGFPCLREPLVNGVLQSAPGQPRGQDVRGLRASAEEPFADLVSSIRVFNLQVRFEASERKRADFGVGCGTVLCSEASCDPHILFSASFANISNNASFLKHNSSPNGSSSQNWVPLEID